MSEMIELLKTLPAVSGSDFTIWKTESENYPYVFISYSFYNEKDGTYHMQIRSGTTQGNFITACAKALNASSNTGFYMYDVRAYYYDLTNSVWVLAYNHSKKNTVAKITVGEEVLTGSAETVIFSTRDIWTSNRVIGYAKDYRFLLSGRKRVESPFDDEIFNREHLDQLGYEAGDDILRIKLANEDEGLYVLKGATSPIVATYTSSSSSTMTLTLPSEAVVTGLRYTASDQGYKENSAVLTNSTPGFDQYVTFSTLDIVFDERQMRIKDHFLEDAVRDQILSISPDEFNLESLDSITFEGVTVPDSLEVTPIIPLETALNPAKESKEVILTFVAGNAHPFEKVLISAAPETLPEEINVIPASIEGFIGTTHQLTVEVLPEEAEDKTVSFLSDKPEIAEVDGDGLVTLKAEGTATITVQSNQVPELSKQVTVTSIRPYEKPVINSLTIDPATPNENETVTFSHDATYDRATFKAEEWDNKKETYEAGQHTVRVRVQDSNDLWSDWKELTFNVNAVYQVPEISNLRMTPEAPGYGEAVEFTYDCVLDPRLTLQKENWTNKQSSYLDGNHTVKLSITDSEGQTSNELTLSFSIERPYDQPSISNLRMTPSNPQPGETVSFSYDKNLDSRLQVKQENWTNKKSSYEAGTHTVKLTVTDTADQTSNELSLTFSIEQPLEAPVISNLRIDPATPNAGEEVSFIYDKVIDERLTLKTENWVGKQDTYEAGQHTVKLTITDSADQVSNELSLTFDVAYVPEVPVLESISMTPPHPVEGEMVTFSYIALIDDQATMQEEIWENKRETYPAGDHEVALTIVDSFNQHSNRLTFNFHVESLPEPSPDPGPTPEPEPNPGPDTDPDNPEMPSQFPKIYDIVIDPPQPRAGELLSYSYTVALEAGTSVQKIEWENKQLIYEESGVVDVALKIIDSKGQEAIKTVEIDVLEASDTPQPPKPTRIKHLEVTRWDSASKRFLILEAREK